MWLAICDDEENIRQAMLARVQRHFPDMEVSIFASAEALLASSLPFSIYLLDIEMPGISGMELARRIRANEKHNAIPQPIIIFVTGYPNHMPEAFDVHAYHYLLKPIEENKFTEVMNQAVKDAAAQLEHAGDSLLITSSLSQHRIRTSDLLFVESNNKKIIFHTIEQTYETYGTINETEEALPFGFFRCHRCYLVNLAHVETYSRTTITVTGGKTVLLAKRKYNDFVEGFMNYAKNGGIVRV